MSTKGIIKKIKERMTRMSFKTGLIMLGLCVVCYALSFAQALLPVSIAMKGVLWVIFFGLAKLFQYSGILILGKGGFKYLKAYFRRKKLPEDSV